MADNKNRKMKKDSPDKNGMADNLYNYAATGRVSDYLESTQLNKFGTKGGTGFAAEDSNALNEKLRGTKVDQVGSNNAKNGADRISDGIPIQTKYFDSASKTVADAFDSSTGQFRYKGMQLEVPSDQYDKAVELMRKKIADGKVPGVTNPEEASSIVKKGSVTYRQARNIARAGNIDSLKYDAKNNLVTSGYAFAIGFAINFARAKWQGKSSKEAMKESVDTGLLSAGTSFIAGIATSQMLRTGLARKATVFVRAGVKQVAKTEWGRLAVDKIASASTGKALSGAAATNHVSKLLRSNVITGVVTTVVITGPDFYRAAISKNTSWSQLGKNFVVNGVGVAAGTAGWMGGAAAGAAIGTMIFPGAGTTVGMVIGGLAGSIGAGSGGSYLSKKTLDYVIEDDAEEMLRIIGDELPLLADEYLLTQDEFNLLLKQVGEACTTTFLREIYAKESRATFVRSHFEPHCQNIVKQRKPVILPAPERVRKMLDDIVSSIDLNDELQQEEAREPYVPNFILIHGNQLTNAPTAGVAAAAALLASETAMGKLSATLTRLF
ncbi:MULTISPECIES: hypothetical protein [unclassified Janthinobacterium]|uniref:hypothetical protein n=1 Tax=unclassified Janthinobacterium TaxID=2610881 RepID=UPI00161808A0|nr:MULTISPECIES: hypothetical protein [unclassified Janthinobacterium]MBB5606557.1 hypothetical protein [Janthinobacterium sp. S3T4]MBB5611572.1 hypothetical protein [Janthinobacterium sp. S3M3]